MMCLFFIKPNYWVSYGIWKVKQSFLAQNQSTVFDIMCKTWDYALFEQIVLQSSSTGVRGLEKETAENVVEKVQKKSLVNEYIC